MPGPRQAGRPFICLPCDTQIWEGGEASVWGPTLQNSGSAYEPHGWRLRSSVPTWSRVAGSPLVGGKGSTLHRRTTQPTWHAGVVPQLRPPGGRQTRAPGGDCLPLGEMVIVIFLIMVAFSWRRKNYHQTMMNVLIKSPACLPDSAESDVNFPGNDINGVIRLNRSLIAAEKKPTATQK